MLNAPRIVSVRTLLNELKIYLPWFLAVFRLQCVCNFMRNGNWNGGVARVGVQWNGNFKKRTPALFFTAYTTSLISVPASIFFHIILRRQYIKRENGCLINCSSNPSYTFEFIVQLIKITTATQQNYCNAWW